jgi:flagellar hook-length control protein FliK
MSMDPSLSMRVAASAPPSPPAPVDQANGGARQQHFERLLHDAGASPQRAAAAIGGQTDSGTGTSDGSPSASAADPPIAEPDSDPDALPIDVLVPGWPPSAMGAVLIAPPAAGPGGPAAAWSAGSALSTAAAAVPAAASPLVAAAATAGGTTQSLHPGPADAVSSPAQTAAANPASGAAAPATLPLPIGGDAVALPLMVDLDPLLRRQEGGDAEAPAPFALASSTSPAGAALGLARTSVVNPMDAPSADLHADDFAETVGGRLLWMAEQKIGHAHIRISPAELGPIEIRMRLDGERVHADFSSGQAEVRQALESSLPKLREMLASQGFTLGLSDVGHHGQSRSSDARQTPVGHVAGTGVGAELESGDAAPRRLALRGLLDAYA